MKWPTVRIVLVCALSLLTMGTTNSSVLGQDAGYLQKAAQSSIFVYDATSQPCAPPPQGKVLLPLGSGFVVGITKRGSTATAAWRGWKFLATVEHVIGKRESIIFRLNRNDAGEFTCFERKLVRSGAGQSVFPAGRPEVDLVAINIPDIPHTDPTVFGYSLILDEQRLKDLEVRVGTDVFAIGYVYGYSGNKQNYPVTKFGKVSLLTDEAWYYSNERKQFEQAYLIELQNTPGMSGAPVMLLGPQFRLNATGQFQFRALAPFVVGVIKGVLISPIGSQGLAAIEPASHLQALLKKIAAALTAAGEQVDLEPTTQK